MKRPSYKALYTEAQQKLLQTEARLADFRRSHPVERMVEDAVARCLTTPNRWELIFSSDFARSQSLMLRPGSAPAGVRVDVMRRMWTFPNGSKVTFGYADGADAARRYSSYEFHRVAADHDTDHHDAAVIRTRERLR